MSKPVVIRLEDGSEYGFEDVKTATKLHPTAEIVRYQDGTAYEAPKPKRARPQKKPAQLPPVSGGEDA